MALMLSLAQGVVRSAPMSVTAKPENDASHKTADSVDARADLEALSKDLQNKLADSEAELADHLANGNGEPDHVRLVEGVLPRKLILQMLIHAYEAQLQRIEELKDRRQAFEKWQKHGGARAEIDQRSAFLFLVEDELRESLVIDDDRLTRLGDMLVYVEQESARRLTLAEQSAARFRQANEEVERSEGEAKVLANERRAALALQNRLGWIQVAATQIEILRIKQDMLELRSKRTLADSQLAQLRGRTQLTEQDMQTVRSEIQAEQKQILTELESMVGKLEGNKGPMKPAQESVDGSATQNSKAVQHVYQQNAEFKLQSLQWMLEFLQLRRAIWEYRWSYAAVSDREKAHEAYERIARWQHHMKAAREYVQQLRLLALDTATDQLKRPEDTHPDVSRPASLLQAYIERVTMLSRLLAVLETNEDLLLRCRQDLDARFQVKSKAERWAEWLVGLREIGGEVWRYELFAAEDVIEVDGEQIKGKRSITLGKVVSALLMLIFGYWLAVKLAAFIERQAIRRLAIDASLAHIARRWILFVAVMLLIAASLMVVRIPLTVFAFMGGAVAIGAGFGMQNLLKNLISGLMLLLERPFRPGDLVEVGGIRGRITDIGVRSSYIRDGNGIETLIPNSTFIEEKVTNWTLSSQSVRISIKVGVAYSSSVEEVTDILLDAAKRHGLVQDKPPPQVLFEDFGSDALIFGLYVWLELSPEVDWRVVASDLRYIINKQFAVKGISVAFPQLDTHVDVNRPVDIRILKD